MNDPHMIILKNYVEKLRNTNPKSYTPNFIQMMEVLMQRFYFFSRNQEEKQTQVMEDLVILV